MSGREAAEGRPAYSYAFQPIVDTAARRIVSYEALVRGPQGEPAPSVFARVAPDALHAFDAASRVVAVETAGRLGIPCRLNLNALPRSLGAADGTLGALLAAAARWHLAPDRLVLEVTEAEAITDHARFAAAIDEARGAGVQVAIDDFGAGHSGLNLLADFQPDVIKLDMNLVRGIEGRGPRQSIARAIIAVCDDLGIEVVAEGVETHDELAWFEHAGVRLFQGYLLARPGFERLPEVRFGEPTPGA